MDGCGQLRWLLPEHWQQPLALPLITRLPPAQGRKLPNGMVLVEDPQRPDDLYKFAPWQRALPAINEIDIYARLYAEQADIAHIVPLKAVAGTSQHMVRQMARSPFGAMDRFLYASAKGQCHLSERQISLLLLPVVQALAQLHAHHIVHRDVKAENVLVFAADGMSNVASSAAPPDVATIQLKLSDFDRAVYLPSGAQLEKPVGSLLHMAPELLAWQTYGHKVDVYAFAMLLFELAHGGRQPHADVGTGMPDSVTRTEFATQVVNDALRPTWAHSSHALKMLAEACWQTDPGQRPEFSDVLAQLKRMAAPVTPVAPAVMPAPMPAIQGVGIACHIGKGRVRMEDAAVVLHTDDSVIAAVFDGLRDARASAFAAHQLPLLLADSLRTDIDTDTNADPIQARLRACLAQVEATLRSLQPTVTSGSTATVALWHRGECWLAWLGDSPAWLLYQRPGADALDAMALVQPHHPTRADEAARMTAAGGRIGRDHIWMDDGTQMPSGPWRVYADADNPERGVALSRALGLFACKPIVSAEADIVRLPDAAAAPRFLLLGSDGVFDSLDRQTVLAIMAANHTSRHALQQAADALIAAVLQRGAADNASVIALDLQRLRKPD